MVSRAMGVVGTCTIRKRGGGLSDGHNPKNGGRGVLGTDLAKREGLRK